MRKNEKAINVMRRHEVEKTYCTTISVHLDDRLSDGMWSQAASERRKAIKSAL